MSALNRWFGNRRVITKILVVAGVAIAGTLAIGALAFVGISDLTATRDREVGRAVPYITNLNQAALEAKAAANDERGYLVAGDGKFRDEALGRQGKITQALTAAHEAARTPAERAKVEEIRTAVDAWFTALRAEFAAYPNDRAAAIASAMGPNRELRKVYERLLAEETKRATEALVTGHEFADVANRSRVEALVLTLVAVLFAVALAVYVGRLIVLPLGRVSTVLDAVADGDLSRDANVDSADEVGQMAAALRRASGNLRATMTSLATHTRDLAAASNEFAADSTEGAGNVESRAQRASMMAKSAADVSRNIEAVAAGAEQMDASIREIAHSATQAAGVASRAVQVAGDTNAVMSKLNESSAEIGNVIKVITSIAEQTNLLALNATIEAARAGDAGKGFAVVASEVKDLAQETARATEDISRRVAAIQSDTSGAVDAIQEIGAIIGQISEYQTAIASAVEEQSATTNEMSRSVSDAASIGRRLAESIDDVAGSVEENRANVQKTNQGAVRLADMSRSLRELMDRFRF